MSFNCHPSRYNTRIISYQPRTTVCIETVGTKSRNDNNSDHKRTNTETLHPICLILHNKSWWEACLVFTHPHFKEGITSPVRGIDVHNGSVNGLFVSPRARHPDRKGRDLTLVIIRQLCGHGDLLGEEEGIVDDFVKVVMERVEVVRRGIVSTSQLTFSDIVSHHHHVLILESFSGGLYWILPGTFLSWRGFICISVTANF